LDNETNRRKQQQGIASDCISSSEVDTDLECVGENYCKSSDIKDSGHISTEIRRNRMENLINTAGDINRAIEFFVGSIFVDRNHLEGDNSGPEEEEEERSIADMAEYPTKNGVSNKLADVEST